MKPHQLPIQHTPDVTTRRRALFPSEGSLDSGIECFSPLNFDEDILSANQSVGDYDIIGLVDDTLSTTPQNKHPLTCITNIKTPDSLLTCSESPTQKLKTPHELPTNLNIPKLTRKSTSEPPPSAPMTPTCTLKSKVRTALFPENELCLPSKSFYPKSEPSTRIRNFVNNITIAKKNTRRSRSLYLCNRRSKQRFGQINAGVGHSIKKPKKNKRLSKSAVIQAALNIIEHSPLNEFFKENETNANLPPAVVVREPSPPPDPSKKFFKTSRHSGVVTLTDNIKLQVNNQKIALMPPKSSLKRAKAPQMNNAKRQKLNDFETENVDPLIEGSVISNILDKLNDSGDKDVLMSPTSLMCNMTSGLALNSPKKAKDLTGVLERMSDSPKMFPIFYAPKTNLPTQKVARPVNPAKKFRALAKDQMLLDAGQKKFGMTQCTQCKLVYHMGDPGDEVMHLDYHDAAHIFRFYGWKNERVVANHMVDERVIHIVPSDSKIWWKKVDDLLEHVNRDLGYYDMPYNATNSQVFLYIKGRSIVGVLVAEVKNKGYRLLNSNEHQVDLCSEESYPIKCGVSRVWVAQPYRHKGIGTSLMNCLRKNFMFGYILRDEDVALSSPTEMGRKFGEGYFKTPNFMIYLM